MLNENRKFHPNKLRRTVLDMAYYGSSVHIACAFSIIEILAVLYRNHLNYPENNPNSDDRDFFVLSKGHGVMAQYACMHELGWLDEYSIRNYFSDRTKLKGLSDSRNDGLEVTSGSLGHGFSIGVGIALGLKLRNSNQKVFSLVGDGELNEGPIWEGILFASHHHLDNMILIVDVNGFQAMGSTNEIIDLGNLKDKFLSFNFLVAEVDGHDEVCIDNCISELLRVNDRRPKVLLAKTVKGKGVAFMEGNNTWHYKRLDTETYEKAINGLASIAC
jgi:transketolase